MFGGARVAEKGGKRKYVRLWRRQKVTHERGKESGGRMEKEGRLIWKQDRTSEKKKKTREKDGRSEVSEVEEKEKDGVQL